MPVASLVFLPCHLYELNFLFGEQLSLHPESLIAAMELNNILSKVSAYWRENNYGK